MTPQFQRHLYGNADSVPGDCHRTCIAMILDLPRDEVPHFMRYVRPDMPADDPAWGAAEDAERAWLAEHGLTPVHWGYDGTTPLEQVLAAVAQGVRDTAVILGCTSHNGVNHSVVVHGGVVYNPNNGEVTGPMADGYWWVTALAHLTRPLPAAPATATVATQENE